jgi:uncharacterized protein (TIGR02001 family)
MVGGASAQDTEVSYNIAATSDYVWRGASQSDGNFALQGGVDITKGSFYAGIWASKVDFGTDDNKEIDFYLGVKPEVGNFAFDFGANHYYFDGSTDAFTELKAAVSHPMGKGSIGAALWVDAETLESPYLEVNASYPLTEKLSVSGAIGHCEGGVSCNLLDSYATYNVGATYSFNEHVTLDMRYSDISQSVRNSFAQPTGIVTLKTSF